MDTCPSKLIIGVDNGPNSKSTTIVAPDQFVSSDVCRTSLSPVRLQRVPGLSRCLARRVRGCHGVSLVVMGVSRSLEWRERAQTCSRGSWI